MEQAEDMMTRDSGQGTGYGGQLYVVWGGISFPFHNAILSMNVEDGKLMFAYPSNPKDALVVDLLQNENVRNLVATQREGENMTRSVLHTTRGMLMANLMNDTVLVIDLDASLDGMGRPTDADR